VDGDVAIPADPSVQPDAAVVDAAEGAAPAAPLGSTCAAVHSPADAQHSSPSPDSLLRLIVLKFAHDRVQAAALKLIPPDRMSGVHCSIASLLIVNLSGSELEKAAVDICGHINTAGLDGFCSDRASAPVADGWPQFFAQEGMVDCVIALEKAAGRQAKAASAYDSAIRFFSAALQLLQRQDSVKERDVTATTEPVSVGSFPAALPASPDRSSFPLTSAVCWSLSRAACLRVYKELVDCFYLSSSYDTAICCIEYVLERVTDLHERAGFFEVRAEVAVMPSAHASAGSDSTRLDSTRLGSTRLGSTRLDSTRRDATRLDSPRAPRCFEF